MQKKLLVVTQFFNIITAIDFDAKKPARYSWELVQARIQDFPEVRAPTLRGGGAPTYDFAKFSQKLLVVAEYVENGTQWISMT